MGKPVGRQGRLRLYEILFAVRERGGSALSDDPGDDVAARHPGLLRGAREMGCRAAARQHQWEPGAAEDADERRARRSVRPLRAVEGDRLPVRLAAQRRRGYPLRRSATPTTRVVRWSSAARVSGANSFWFCAPVMWPTP